jgi:hypothetical protein
MVRNDDDTALYPLDYLQGGAWYIAYGSQTIGLIRTASGVFDGVDYNSVTYNRGWITIDYVV